MIDTHTPELNENVAVLLLKLKVQYLAKEQPNKEIYIKDDEIVLVKKYIGRLKKTVEKAAQTDEELKKAWEYVRDKMDSPADHWDIVSYWQAGTNGGVEKATITITIKEALGLTYAALTDKSAFWEGAKKKAFPKGGTDKEILELREKFEKAYKADKKNRLLTLWNTFKALNKKRVCHAGIRNDITMALNGVVPGVFLIENVNDFIHELFEKHLQEQIDYFKELDNGRHYTEVLLGEIAQERSERLKQRLEETKEGLQEEIVQQCQEHGLNPGAYEHLINNSFACLDDLSLSWKTHEFKWVRSLAVLLGGPKDVDEVGKQFRQWAKGSFELGNKEHEKMAIAFVKVKEAFFLYPRHQAILRNWKQEQLSNEETRQLGELLNAYQKQCIEMKGPCVPSKELEVLSKKFITAYKLYLQDQRADWVENIFGAWFGAEDPATRQQLFHDLSVPSMREKYQATDAFLDGLYNQNNETIYLDLRPYQINRVFLHALMVPPNQWTERFYGTFKEVYGFVEAGFKNNEGQQQAESLKRGSYPLGLMAQLKYALDYYGHHHGDENSAKPEPVDMVFPMPNLVFSAQGLNFMLGLMATENEQASFLKGLNSEQLKLIIQDGLQLIEVLLRLPKDGRRGFLKRLNNDGWLKPIIKDWFQLVGVLSHLPEDGQTEFLQGLGSEWLKSIIKNDSLLVGVLKCLPWDGRTEFLQSLGSEWLKSIIKNDSQLFQVLFLLPEDGRTEFLQSLGDVWLKSIIKNDYQLAKVLSHLPEDERRGFLKRINNDGWLKSIIQNGEQLLEVLFRLPKDGRTEFLKYLSSDGWLKSIIQNGKQLAKVLSHLPEDEWRGFLQSLDDKWLKSIIKNGGQLIEVLLHLPEDGRTRFLQGLNNDEWLKSIIQNSCQLIEVLLRLPEDGRTEFLKCLNSDGWLKSIIQNSCQLIEVLLRLPEDGQTGFLQGLGDGWLKLIILDGKDLTMVLWCLPEDGRTRFLQGLNNEWLKSTILDGNQLIEVLLLLSEDERAGFLQGLGDGWLKLIIKDWLQLVGVLLRLPEKGWTEYLKRLNSDGWLKSIIKNDYLLVEVVKYLPRDERRGFLQGLDDKWLKSIILNGKQLVGVLNYLPKDEWTGFLQGLNNDGWLKSIIKNNGDLIQILLCLPEDERRGFLQGLNNDGWLKSTILDGKQLVGVLNYLPEGVRTGFLQSLDDGWLKSIIKNNGDLIQILLCLPGDERRGFLQSLDDGWLKSIILDGKQLVGVLNYLPEGVRTGFLQSLDDGWLKSIIQNGEQLAKVLSWLSNYNQQAFLDAMGKDKLREIFQKNGSLGSFDQQGFSLLTKIKLRFTLLTPEDIGKAINNASDDYLYANSRIGYEKHQNAGNSLITGMKIFGTFGIYCAYRSYKYDCHVSKIDTNKSPIENLLAVLGARESNNDLHSFNYYLASHLLKLSASSDEEAKQMVETLKTVLKNEQSQIQLHFSSVNHRV